PRGGLPHTTASGRGWLFHLMDVVQDAPGDADGQDGQLAHGLVPDAPGDIDHHALVQVDLLIVEDHPALPVDDVVELVGALVVVQLGVVDLDVVDLGGSLILLFDDRADLAAGLGPGLDLGGVTAQEPGYGAHGSTPDLWAIRGVALSRCSAGSYTTSPPD